MQSIKMEKIIEKLTKNYFPFNLLSNERAYEVANLVRFIEMREGEIFQLTGGSEQDYLFVVEGRLELIQKGRVRSIAGPKETRTRPLSIPSAPSTSTLVAHDDSIICHANREMLDQLLSWDEIVHVTEASDRLLHEQIKSVRNSLVFRRLPMECVEEAFRRMNLMTVKAGQNIITQGEAGDAFYVITRGKADVFQIGLYDDDPRKVSELEVGDAFGDEALISGKRRSETVTMATSGEILVLHESDFKQLIGKELVRTVSAKIAITMLETGYKLVDVRYSGEYDDEHIPNALLIPLSELRDRYAELGKNAKYLVYCHSGNRSAVAAMIMSQNNYEVLSLEGGIRDWPFATVSVDVSH